MLSLYVALLSSPGPSAVMYWRKALNNFVEVAEDCLKNLWVFRNCKNKYYTNISVSLNFGN